MKYLYKTGFLLVLLISLSSCADNSLTEVQMQKPQSVALQDSLNEYKTLETYIDTVKYPDFKLGAAVSASEYLKKGALYHLVNSNFNQITLGNAMKYGAVANSDGSLDFSTINKLLQAAKEAGISVYGHNLIWNKQQPGDYLRSLITSSSPWDPVVSLDFEKDTSSSYSVRNADKSFTAEGEGANGKGRALKVTNPKVRDHDWGSQLFVSFPAVKKGEKYKLTMDVRADEKASFTTQAQTAPGVYLFYNFFGTITATTEWTTYTKVITVGKNRAGATTIAFNLGNTATTYYFDNIVVSKYNKNSGQVTGPQTEETKEIISEAMKSWIKAMMKHTPYVHAWDVVNEPLVWMTGAQPFKLKTGVGQELSSGEFYWQDYMGKDYAVKAFKWAEKYGGGDDLLFINDYNLARNLEKCKGLINYVNYIESKGATVDGIGTQMHISINTDKDKIARMFELLAGTDELIRISELDIGVGVPTSKVTPELAKEQAEMYKYVIKKYFEIIPEDQRYGITDWSIIDRLSGWRAKQSVGLWTKNYERKRAYAGFAKGLIIGQENAK